MQEVNSNQEATSNRPSKTSKKLLKEVHTFLSESKVFSSFPLSLLLLGLEELTEKEFFICPCQSILNIHVTVFIFIGPAFLMFALMFLVLRPFRLKCLCVSECKEKNENNKKNENNCFNAFLSCLIPSVMWIIILLLDGDYVACGKTYWNGVYKFDNQLHRCWCKPTEETRNEKVLQDLTRAYIHRSQLAGYVVMSIFSVLVTVIVGVCDCYSKPKKQSEDTESASLNASGNVPSTSTVN